MKCVLRYGALDLKTGMSGLGLGRRRIRLRWRGGSRRFGEKYRHRKFNRAACALRGPRPSRPSYPGFAASMLSQACRKIAFNSFTVNSAFKLRASAATPATWARQSTCPRYNCTDSEARRRECRGCQRAVRLRRERRGTPRASCLSTGPLVSSCCSGDRNDTISERRLPACIIRWEMRIVRVFVPAENTTNAFASTIS